MISAEEIMQSFHIIPIIVLGAYVFAEILKKFFLKTDTQRASIPAICGVIGGAIGLIFFYTVPSYLDPDTTTAIGAIADGAFSGIAATGCNQLYKQIKKIFNPSGTVTNDSN